MACTARREARSGRRLFVIISCWSNNVSAELLTATGDDQTRFFSMAIGYRACQPAPRISKERRMLGALISVTVSTQTGDLVVTQASLFVILCKQYYCNTRVLAEHDVKHVLHSVWERDPGAVLRGPGGRGFPIQKSVPCGPPN